MGDRLLLAQQGLQPDSRLPGTIPKRLQPLLIGSGCKSAAIAGGGREHPRKTRGEYLLYSPEINLAW